MILWLIPHSPLGSSWPRSLWYRSRVFSSAHWDKDGTHSSKTHEKSNTEATWDGYKQRVKKNKEMILGLKKNKKKHKKTKHNFLHLPDGTSEQEGMFEVCSRKARSILSDLCHTCVQTVHWKPSEKHTEIHFIYSERRKKGVKRL